MIRHRPFGRGHAYLIEPDQRVPAQPVEGERIELRASTDGGVDGGHLELEVDGRGVHLPLVRFEPSDPDQVTAASVGPDAGHLAAAAARTRGHGRSAWRATLPAQRAGTRLRYRFVTTGGARTRWFATTVAGWTRDGGELTVDVPWGAAERLVADSVEWLVADSGPVRLRFALRLRPGDHVVGFGERFDRLDQRGERLDCVVFEQYRHQGKRTYVPIPFAIVVPRDGSPAWGFHVRTARRTWYDVGASDPDRLAIEVALDPAEPVPTVEVAIYEGSPRASLAAFLEETGDPALPPAWVFRLWMSANEWNTDARVRAEVERTIVEGIPAGVLVIEAWSDETTFVAFRDARYGVHPDGAPHRLAEFTFAPDGAWPDPKGLADWLHERDIRLVLWQIPLLSARPVPRGQARADRDTMIGRGYAVRTGEGRPYRNAGWWFPGALLPDWTNPEAADWWVAKRRYLVEEVGVDGFKTDGGEHAWGDSLRYADGTRGVDTNNRYPVLYEAAYQRMMREAGRVPVTFSRAGFTGAATVPCHWAGDEGSTWEAFRASVTAGLSAGASGVFFWGWDLAGFSGEIPDAELYLRSAAMACLCPIMQYHAEYNRHRRPSRDRTPWNIAERTGDPRVLPVFRRFAQLRERLLPYLEAEARLSVERRLPLMRALFFDWPDDPAVWEHPYEYLLGDELLVAPVVEPGRAEWETYLPDGEWIGAWHGERVAGPRRLTVPAPLDEIPVFIRASAADRLRPVFEAEAAR